MVTITFWVYTPGGLKAIATHCFPNSRSALSLIRAFRRARRALPRSSRSLFGAGFPRYSLRWVAAHTGYMQINDRPRVKFTHPYLRFIVHPLML